MGGTVETDCGAVAANWGTIADGPARWLEGKKRVSRTSRNKRTEWRLLDFFMGVLRMQIRV